MRPCCDTYWRSGYTAVADHGGPAVAVGQVGGVEGLAQRADLVDLEQHGVGDPAVEAALDALDVGDEQVVANELHPVPQGLVARLPAVPVLLGEAVLERDDRIA